MTRNSDLAVSVVSEPPIVRAPSQHSDSELLSRAIEGDARAFDEIYRRHHRYIAGVIYRLLGQDRDLDDCVQDTFVVALKKMHTLRDPARLRPWLARIAVRAVQRRLGRTHRRRHLLSQWAVQTVPEAPPEARERIEAVYWALDGLSPRLRIPWALHRIEGHTLPELAELCGCSVSTAKRRVSEAEGRMEQRLQRYAKSTKGGAP